MGGDFSKPQLSRRADSMMTIHEVFLPIDRDVSYGLIRVMEKSLVLNTLLQCPHLSSRFVNLLGRDKFRQIDLARSLAGSGWFGNLAISTQAIMDEDAVSISSDDAVGVGLFDFPIVQIEQFPAKQALARDRPGGREP